MNRPFKIAYYFQNVMEMKEKHLYADRMFSMTCPACSKFLTLDKAKIALKDGVTQYSCRQCDILLLVIAEHPNKDWIGEGWSSKDYILLNKAEILFELNRGTRIPMKGHPSAFDRANS